MIRCLLFRHIATIGRSEDFSKGNGEHGVVSAALGWHRSRLTSILDCAKVLIEKLRYTFIQELMECKCLIENSRPCRRSNSRRVELVLGKNIHAHICGGISIPRQ